MSLLEELARLSQPAPSLPDLEDAGDGAATLVSKSAIIEEEALGTTGRRRILRAELQDDEGKYEGEKVERRLFFEGSNEMTGMAAASRGEEEEEVSMSEEDEDESGSGDEMETETESGAEESADEQSEEESGDETDQNDDDEQEVEGLEEPSKIQVTTKSADQEKEEKKACSVREQQRIWEQLLHANIKTHTMLRLANQLPRGQVANQLRAHVTPSAKLNATKINRNLSELTSILLATQEALLSGASLTRSCLEKGTLEDSDDEEIKSSEDEKSDASEGEDEDQDAGGLDEIDELLGKQQHDDGDDGAEKLKNLNKKTTKGDTDAEKELSRIDEAIDKLRKSTLSKWHSRTRLLASKHASRDFSAFDGEINRLIENVMADKKRLLKKTQTKKCEGDRIGGDRDAEEDGEIYDDTDFYQVLLKEFIEKKTTGQSEDAVVMSRNYIDMKELQARRSKKKSYCYAASKDKRIKYVPIPKLINFHPAQPETVEWTHETRNELFKSLFT